MSNAPTTVVVPVEPTREMWAAGADAVYGQRKKPRVHHDKLVGAVWSAMIAATQQPEGEGCAYCGPGVRTGLPGNACENCMGTGLNDPMPPSSAWGEEVLGDAEELAWVWLNLQQDCSPADIDYSADQMVDAFMAGRASKLLEALSATQQPVSEGVETDAAFALRHALDRLEQVQRHRDGLGPVPSVRAAIVVVEKALAGLPPAPSPIGAEKPEGEI